SRAGRVSAPDAAPNQPNDQPHVCFDTEQPPHGARQNTSEKPSISNPRYSVWTCSHPGLPKSVIFQGARAKMNLGELAVLHLDLLQAGRPIDNYMVERLPPVAPLLSTASFLCRAISRLPSRTPGASMT